MSRHPRASHVPLFDRLCELEAAPDGVPVSQAPRAVGLPAPLHADLHRLLQTRNGLTRSQFLACEGTVLQYGLPDLQGLSASSQSDLDAVAQVVAHSLRLFEPRLVDVQVQAQPDSADSARARVRVSARTVQGPATQRVAFAIALDEPGGPVTPCE